MAYTKTNWVNDETELSAENFNKIENGIANVEPIKLLGIDITPEDYSIGDKYYNSEENKIYTATSSSTFDDGEEPTDGHFYLVLSDNANYYYDGETLVAVGGGKEPIVISEDEPSTEDGALLWVDTGELNSISSEVVDSLEGNETNKAPSVRAVKQITNYSTNETFTGSYWIDGEKIYRKVVNIPNLPNATGITIAHGIQNFKMAIDIRGIAYIPNQVTEYYPMPLQYRGADSAYNVQITVRNEEIIITSSQDRSQYTAFVIIEYIKTTD